MSIKFLLQTGVGNMPEVLGIITGIYAKWVFFIEKDQELKQRYAEAECPLCSICLRFIQTSKHKFLNIQV